MSHENQGWRYYFGGLVKKPVPHYWRDAERSQRTRLMLKLDHYDKPSLIKLEAMYSAQGKTKQAEQIRHEIASRIRDERKAKGELSWLADAGYSGRNSNK